MLARPKRRFGLVAAAVWRTASTMVLATALAGCVTSKEPLFDQQKSVVPWRAGNFIEEKNDYGQWKKTVTLKVARHGRLYTLQRSESDKVVFILHDVGNGYFVATRPDVKKRIFVYALFSERAGYIYYYEPRCKDFQFVRLPKSLWPMVDGENCVYDNREKLVSALLAYAHLSNPDMRYRRAQP